MIIRMFGQNAFKHWTNTHIRRNNSWPSNWMANDITFTMNQIMKGIFKTESNWSRTYAATKSKGKLHEEEERQTRIKSFHSFNSVEAFRARSSIESLFFLIHFGLLASHRFIRALREWNTKIKSLSSFIFRLWIRVTSIVLYSFSKEEKSFSVDVDCLPAQNDASTGSYLINFEHSSVWHWDEVQTTNWFQNSIRLFSFEKVESWRITNYIQRCPCLRAEFSYFRQCQMPEEQTEKQIGSFFCGIFHAVYLLNGK